MLKKLMIIAGGVLLVLFLLLGKDIVHHFTQVVDSAQEWVKDQESPEYKLDRAKRKIGELEEEIIEAQEHVARKEIERDRLAVKLSDLQDQMAIHAEEMLTLKNGLESGETQFVFDGVTYSDADVRADLEIRLERYQILKETVTDHKEQLSLRNSSLREQLAQIRTMENNKQKYELEVAKLEARLENLRVKEAASSEAKIVDSNSADIRETLDEVEVIAATREKVVDGHKKTGLIPVSKPREKLDILERVTQELSPGAEATASSK